MMNCKLTRPHVAEVRTLRRFNTWFIACLTTVTSIALVSCGKDHVARAGAGSTQSSLPEVAVTRVDRRPMARYLTISSELVPFQEIDVYAKESGFVSKLNVRRPVAGRPTLSTRLTAMLDVGTKDDRNG